MPLGSTTFWACILPVQKTNLVTNPSFEFGTAGWGTLQAGTIGTASNEQQFGAWSGSIAPTSNGTTGAVGPTFTAGNGTAYTFSAYVRGVNGVDYRLGVGDSNGANLVGSVNFTGGGTWHRYVGSWTEASGATRRMVVKKNADNNTGGFYIDGAMVEIGSLTTYVDGDQDGCYWLGAQHNSASIRSGTYRGGGSVVALADLGLKPDQMPGAGMAPQDVTTQSYAILPGAEYQRSRADQRTFTLSFQPILGTTMQGFHVTRRTILEAFDPDDVSPQQPIRFWYTGGQGTIQIDAVYAGGLELGDMNGPMAEEGAVKFLATDPYWYSPFQQGTALAPRVNLGSTNSIIWRDPIGKWGTLGANGTTVWAPSVGDALIFALAQLNGSVFFGGHFGSVAGVGVTSIGYYANGALGSMPGGGANNQVVALTTSASGTLYAGGIFTNMGGTAANYIAAWSGAWGTMIGGTITANAAFGVLALDVNQGGTLFVGGTFNGITPGTTARNIARWFNGAWGTLDGQQGGTVNGEVDSITTGLDNRLYFGGAFTLAGGTTATGIAQWNGSFGTMTTGVDGAPDTLVTMQDGRIAVIGAQFNAGGGSVWHTAAWNGVQFQPFGSGVTGFPLTGFVRADNSLLVGGLVTAANNVPVPTGGVVWNGATFVPMDVALPGITGGFNSFTETPDGTLYAGGYFFGTGRAASVTTIVNKGRAQTYPTVRFRNTSTGTARIYQLANTATGDAIYFNLALLGGEQATLELTPGNRSFISSFRGNIFGNIMPGSNLATWVLQTGTNYVSLFADNDSLETSIYWPLRGWSIDTGTIV